VDFDGPVIENKRWDELFCFLNQPEAIFFRRCSVWSH
jgi:hypothetical protein